MAHRRTVRPSRDRKFFTRTAAQSKRINVDPKIYRGGIRL